MTVWSLQVRRPVLWGSLAVGLLLVFGAIVGIGRGWLVIGSGAGGWTYPYLQPFSWTSLLIGIGSAVAIAGVAAIRWRSAGGGLIGVMLGIGVLTAAHGAMRTQAVFGVETLFTSPGANSFYSFAQEVGPGELLGKFERSRRDAPLHAQSNMPGKTLLVHGLQQVTRRTDVLPWLVMLLSNCGALVMFGLVARLTGDVRCAVYAALLYLVTPGRLFFLPIMNAVTPLIAIAFAWALVRCLQTGGIGAAALAGGLLYALVFFEPLPLVLGLLFAAWAAAAVLRRELRLETLLIQAGAIAAFALLAGVALYETTGFNLLRAFRRIGTHAVEFNAQAARPYDVWVRANLGEFLLGAGPATIILTLALPVAAWIGRARVRDWLARLDVATSLGLIAVLLATDAIGINRGEVIRLWIFLACFFQIPAAMALTHLGRVPVVAVLTTTIILVSIATARIGFVVP